MRTLLEIALTDAREQTGRSMSSEQIDLAEAWLSGRVSYRAAQRALRMKSSNIYAVLARGAKVLYQREHRVGSSVRSNKAE